MMPTMGRVSGNETAKPWRFSWVPRSTLFRARLGFCALIWILDGTHGARARRATQRPRAPSTPAGRHLGRGGWQGERRLGGGGVVSS